MAELLYEDLTAKIRQSAFDVHEYFRNGFLEKVYENALAYKLRKQNLNCDQQVALKVYYEDDVVVGEYIADLVVENKIIIELKNPLGKSYKPRGKLNLINTTMKSVNIQIIF